MNWKRFFALLLVLALLPALGSETPLQPVRRPAR